MHFRFTHLSPLKNIYTPRLSKLWELGSNGCIASAIFFLPLAGLKLQSRWCLLQCHGDVEIGDDGNGDAACVLLGSFGSRSSFYILCNSRYHWVWSSYKT